MADHRDPDEIRRHERHLVAQIYHLIELNETLRKQVQRLDRVTELAALFREGGISRDTFEMPPPRVVVPPRGDQCWARVEELLEELPEGPVLTELKEQLGQLRVMGWVVDPDWIADTRNRLISAEQTLAFLEEQTREMDLLRQEKDAIVDGASRLQQTVDDLWKSLNDKTTHIRRLEQQLNKIWTSPPYRLFRVLTRPFRRS